MKTNKISAMLLSAAIACTPVLTSAAQIVASAEESTTATVAETTAAAAEAVANAQVQSVTDANGLQAVKVTFDSGILFATNKSTLNSVAKSSLSQFASQVLNVNPDMDVAIFGHTDNTGSDAINNPLSQKRAEAVESYLNSCGVAPRQIATVQGKGSYDPVATNTTAEGRQLNRRVEVFIYASQAMIEAAQNGTLQ